MGYEIALPPLSPPSTGGKEGGGLSPEILSVFIDEERANALTEDEAYNIYRALLNIKICDPAIGSGAFLVAMMNELVAIFRRLASRLSEGQFRYIFENKLADPRSVYDLKLHILWFLRY